MHARTVAAAVLSFTATLIFAIELASWTHSARFGPNFSTATRCTPTIVSVSEIDKMQGLRDGDVLQLPAMDFAARLAVAYRYLPVQTGKAGETIVLAVERAGARLQIPYVLRNPDRTYTFLAEIGFKLFMFALGLLVLWRGRDRASLMLAIWCLGIFVCLPDAWWGLLPPAGRLWAAVLSVALWTYSPLPLYLVIESLASGLAARTKWIARIIVTTTLVPSLFDTIVNPAAQVTAGCSVVSVPRWLVADIFVATQFAIMAFFILYYVRSSGLVRQRLRWVFWAFLISRFGVLLNLVNRIVAHPIHLSGIEWLTVMIFPLGCAYAILRHRIIDVNFVINRTLIYTVLTSIAVGIFLILESLFSHLAVTRGVGLAVELVVALALGFSFNALHKRVETTIDRVLFRRKYQAAQELTQLAEESAYMENPDALLARAVHEIPRAVSALGAAVYERVGDTYKRIIVSDGLKLPASLPIDDLAFVRLRMKIRELYLADVDSALGTQGIAFPLAIRGQLFGAYICGARGDGEAYAPDEVRTLARITHELGAELFAMRMRRHQELLESILSGSIDIDAAQERFQTPGWQQSGEEQKPQPANG